MKIIFLKMGYLIMARIFVDNIHNKLITKHMYDFKSVDIHPLCVMNRYPIPIINYTFEYR